MKIKIARIMVGLIVFALSIAIPLILLKPDPAPVWLTGKAWLPAGNTPSSLLSERNLEKQRGLDKTVSLKEFKKMAFVQSDMVLTSAETSDRSLTLDYFGKTAEGKFVSALVPAGQTLPSRSPMYEVDWSTFTFDRSTGQVKALSGLNEIGLGIALLAFAATLALSFAVATPESLSEAGLWVTQIFCAGLELACFGFWAYNRAAWLVEGSLFVIWVGVVALWCFILYWGLLTEERDGAVFLILLSVFLAALGAGIETLFAVADFSKPGQTVFDGIGIFALFFLTALAIDALVAVLLKQEESREKLAKVKS